jgi:hypothetical protein
MQALGRRCVLQGSGQLVIGLPGGLKRPAHEILYQDPVAEERDRRGAFAFRKPLRPDIRPVRPPAGLPTRRGTGSPSAASRIHRRARSWSLDFCSLTEYYYEPA